MEYLKLFQIGSSVTQHLITKASKAYKNSNWPQSSFNDLPTAMLFCPNDDHEGSLHYMHFPAAASQKFHYHPSPRYLILFGDVDVCISYSEVSPSDNPMTAQQLIILPKNTLNIVRFRSQLWHKFSTNSEVGLGVIAFSFHGNDNVLDLSKVGKDLMEEVTVFWNE